MSETKHTPGKWEVSQYNPHEIWVGANINIATCHRLRGEGIANAHLIAAAPALFEACKKYHKALQNCNPDAGDEVDEADRMGKAAISAGESKE